MIVSPEILPRMSAGQYLDYEQTQEVRHELVDGYLYAMVGASDRHEEIAMNLAAALSLHLLGGPCRVYKSHLKLRIGDDFYYPDIFVRCGTERGDPYFKTDPVLIVGESTSTILPFPGLSFRFLCKSYTPDTTTPAYEICTATALSGCDNPDSFNANI